jgi:acyl-CoA hydrolase
MENHKLVLPEHLNHYGYLFGGMLLQWVDEYAWIAATLDHPGCKFVTIAMDRVEFRKSVREGTILRFDIRQSHLGRTSVQYEVVVFADDPQNGKEEAIFTNHVTFVRLDADGHKRAIDEMT